MDDALSNLFREQNSKKEYPAPLLQTRLKAPIQSLPADMTQGQNPSLLFVRLPCDMAARRAKGRATNRINMADFIDLSPSSRFPVCVLRQDSLLIPTMRSVLRSSAPIIHQHNSFALAALAPPC